MRAIVSILWQDIKNLFTNPMWLFYDTIFTFLLVWSLGFLCKGLYGNGVTSYDYYGIALMLFAILNHATIAANSFMEERIKAGNMRVLFSPIAAHWLYRSKIIASFVFGVVCHGITMLVLAACFRIHLGEHLGVLLLCFLFAELFSSALGVFLCCLLKSEATANQILSLVVQLLSCFGGVFFSLDRFGEVIRRISFLSPVKWLLQSIFLLIYDARVLPILATCAGLLMMTMLLLWGCKKTFRVEDCI